MLQRRAGGARIEFADDLADRGQAAAAELHRLVLGLDPGGQLGQRGDGHGRMDDEGGGHRADIGQVIEAGQRVVAVAGHQRGRDRQRRRVRHEQRVAVGGRLRHQRGADGRAGAGLVLDDHGLAQPLGQRGRDQPRGDVAGAAGREGDDQSQRACGPGGVAARPMRGRARGSASALAIMKRRREMGMRISCVAALGGKGPYCRKAPPGRQRICRRMLMSRA